MQMRGADFARLLIRATKCMGYIPLPANVAAKVKTASAQIQ
jgi:hypothetical protein